MNGLLGLGLLATPNRSSSPTKTGRPNQSADHGSLPLSVGVS